MSFDRIIATLAGVAVVGLVSFLLVRNEPIADARLFFALRLIMSVAAATLGATLPGFLQVSWKGGGLAVRAGGALALFVLSYLYTPSLASADEHASKTTEIIGSARDINASTVNITVVKYNYLKNETVANGIIRQGWFGVSENFSQLIEADKDNLAIFPIGNVGYQIGFILASKKNSNIIVDQLSLNLKSYEDCNRRDEFNRLLGYAGEVNKEFFISKHFQSYPITPLSPDLTNAIWQYKGGDADEFLLSVSYDPYVLYLVTISVDYRDLSISGEKKHVESNQYELIRVANGNSGGCLDVNSWYDESKKKIPEKNSYSEGIPTDIYQLLTANLNRDPGLMNIFLRSSYLKNRDAEIKKIVDSRPENKIFKSNYEIWKRNL